MGSSSDYSSSSEEPPYISNAEAFGLACFGLLVFLLLEIIDRRGDRRA
jgi:hypothetical protein